MAAVARDICTLLNGETQASMLARDSLRTALVVDPLAIEGRGGMVLQAMRFLATYGIYLTVSTDRFVSRMLDAKQAQDGLQPQAMVGSYDTSRAEAGRSLCRVGALANTLRLAVRQMREAGIQQHVWGTDPSVWAQSLPNMAFITPNECSGLAAAALRHSGRDWHMERAMFGVLSAPSNLDEDWPEEAWENPLQRSPDPRSRALIAPSALALSQDDELAFFSDGGLDRRHGATFGAVARRFVPGDQYWESSQPASVAVSRRLPSRFGHEAATVHTAELAGLVAALRWRRAGAWNLVVADRSALFSVMAKLREGLPSAILRHTCAPLESLLRSILADFKHNWAPPRVTPSWRQNQILQPERWHVTRQSEEGAGKVLTLSKVPYTHDGLVGVDVKSHQSAWPRQPYPIIADGNDMADAACETARQLPLPQDVLLPTGGFLAFLTLDGRMVTGSVAKTIRGRLRSQAETAWRQRAVQGKVATLATHLFTRVLDLRMYSACSWHARWRTLALKSDKHNCVDSSKVLYRCIRAIILHRPLV